MIPNVSLLKLVYKRTCSWFALSLLLLCGFLLFGPLWGEAPPSSLKIWEIVVALLISFQLVISTSIGQLIHSHLPPRLYQRWISNLIEGCFFVLLLLLAAFVFNPMWNHVLLIQGPFVIALVLAMLVMMGFYLSGRFS